MPLGSDKPLITKNIGQAPGSQIGAEISHRIDDTSRIAQMLISKPGLKYLLHEAQLQQIGVGERIKKAQQGGKSVAGAVLGQLGNTVVTTLKIAGSTLAQVPVNGTGTHFLKAFRTDTYLQPSGGNNRSGFAQFFGAGGVEGAQYALRGQAVPGGHKTELSSKPSDLSPYSTTEDKVATNTTKGFNNVNFESSPYINKQAPKTKISGSIDKQGIVGSGLLDSSENLGKTYNASSTYTGNSTEDVVGNALGGKRILTKEISGSYRPTGFAQDYQPTYQPFPDPTPISQVSKKDATKGPSTKIEDFRQKNTANLSSYSYDYNSAIIHKEQRVSLGNQGKASSKTSYMAVDPDKVDKVNALDISSTLLEGVTTARDLAKFYFEIITPDGSKFLYFRAFIDSIDDGYNADWQGRKYNGRAENFYTYGGFDRDISISFNIAAASRSEMKPLYRKMVYLASATAPTYGTSGLMRGTLARMTVGSYLAQIPGVITSVKFTLDNNTPWEIAMGNPDGGGGNTTDDDVQELPMMLKCSVSFKPIHDFAPQTGLYNYFTSPKPLNGSKPFFTEGETIK
jgi:hypothetical protein